MQSQIKQRLSKYTQSVVAFPHPAARLYLPTLRSGLITTEACGRVFNTTALCRPVKEQEQLNTFIKIYLNQSSDTWQAFQGGNVWLFKQMQLKHGAKLHPDFYNIVFFVLFLFFSARFAKNCHKNK